ncbi:flagellar filament capping protein FliD [Nocardioides sp.]|uniref:flagellar filament capping protein FliD n=1 Tax=Nocardioides sp. TaxID=35761 RepID=UPI001A3572DB|nr:flagellar filament capping protein FliD [Nocardioides sp.]MBJ7358824.1 flagellar filament capping protein FliD [Nocardioides sp.]
MVSSASISGLASGLDTDTIVTQLMQLEALPQTRLKQRVSTEKSLVTTLHALNTKTALLASKAADLAKAATWSAVTSTSTNAAVRVSGTTTAEPVRLNVTVTSVARTHQLGFTQAAALTDPVTGASTKVRLDRFDGTPVDLETGDGTLKSLAAAINDPANDTGLRATTIKTTGGYRLLVESAETGAAKDFDLTALDGSPLLGGATVRAGADAALDLGSGISVTSATNTFADIVPGVTITLGSDAVPGTVSTVDVSRNTTKLSAALTDLVAAMNSVLSEIDTQTGYDATTKKAGPLAGDGSVRTLRSSVLNTIFPTASSESLASIGLQTDRSGKVTFDAATFASAYATDPAGTAARFTDATDGFAVRLAGVAKAASDPLGGTITNSILGRNSGIDRLQARVDDWDVRLEKRQESLKRQFTALETAMNQMSTQSSWLSSQLSSLSSNSSS